MAAAAAVPDSDWTAGAALSCDWLGLLSIICEDPPSAGAAYWSESVGDVVPVSDNIM